MTRVVRQIERSKNGMDFTFRLLADGTITREVKYGKVLILAEHPVILGLKQKADSVGTE